MDCDADLCAIRQELGQVPRSRDVDYAAEDAPGSRDAHRQDDGRPDQRAFEIEPPAARFDLACVWPLVQTPLAALLVLEVLDRIGDENRSSRYPGIAERLVENTARRAHKPLAAGAL